MKDTIGGIIGFIIIVFFASLIFSNLGGADTSCGGGYHWEEDYRGTVGGCIHD